MAGVPLNSSPGAGRGARRPRRADGLRAAPRRRGPCVHTRPGLGRNAGHRRRTRRAALRPRQRACRPRDVGRLTPPRHHRPRQPVPRLPRPVRATTPGRCSGPSGCAIRSTSCAPRLDSLPRNTPEYRELYAGFSRLDDSLSRGAEANRSGPARTSIGPAPISSSAAKACARGSGTGKIAPTEGTTASRRSLAARRRQDPRTDTTGGDGWARFHASRGATGGSTAGRGTRPIPTPSGTGTCP